MMCGELRPCEAGDLTAVRCPAAVLACPRIVSHLHRSNIGKLKDPHEMRAHSSHGLDLARRIPHGQHVVLCDVT